MAWIRIGSSFGRRSLGPIESAQAGFSLLELLAALSIFGVVTALLYGALSAQVRLARATADRVAAAEAIRTAAHVVAGEIRRTSATDLHSVSADSIALRAFRGTAVVCTTDGGTLTVRYRGDRAPDPAKDSVLVIGATTLTPAMLVDSRPAPSDMCTVDPGETAMAWTTEPAQDSAAVMLLFETGSYHISAGALRYRRGAGGRQPLTAELFQRPPSRFEAEPDAVVMTLEAGASRALRIRAPVGARAEP